VGWVDGSCVVAVVMGGGVGVVVVAASRKAYKM
jgi:hypothetical protein